MREVEMTEEQIMQRVYGQDDQRMSDRQFANEAANILQNMSLEKRGFWRQLFGRWHISDEPLRHDAANLLRRAGVEFSCYPKGTQRVGDDQDYLHKKERS